MIFSFVFNENLSANIGKNMLTFDENDTIFHNKIIEDPHNKFVLSKLVHSIIFDAERSKRQIFSDPRYDNESIEVENLSKSLIKKVINYSDYDVTDYVRHMKNSIVSKKNKILERFLYSSNITVKELFIRMIVVLEISFTTSESKLILEKIIYSQNKDTNTVPTDIRLSRVIGHSYEGLSYNINNNKSSFVYMDDENKNSMVIAGAMVKFLLRKNVLIVDYDHFFEKFNGTEVIIPQSSNQLHRGPSGIYYHNLWHGSQFFNDENNGKRNSLMAVLSFIKYKMNRAFGSP